MKDKKNKYFCNVNILTKISQCNFFWYRPKTYSHIDFTSNQVNNATARVQTKKPPTVPNGK